ncbi:MAG: hypothetical protein LBT13_04425, partial [Treponema sp.]|nr:hypothetical protein [Treponema sp.]
MKKNKLFLGMLAAALTFGLTLTGCPTDPDPEPEPDLTTPYTITVNPPAVGDGTASSSVLKAKAGDTVTLTASPASGKKFTFWSGVTVAAPTSATTTFTMPASNVTITATFEALGTGEYTVTTSAAHGAVSVSPGYGKAGAVIALTVAPDKGYKLTSLTPSAGTITPTVAATVSTYTLTLPASLTANVTVTAAFQAIQYTITLPTTDTNKGTVTASLQSSGPAITTAAYGDRVSLNIHTMAGYIFDKGTFAVTGASGAVYDNFNGGSSSSDGSITGYSFTMPAENITVSASFVTPITVNGSLVIKTKGLTGQLSGANLYLYSDASYDTQVASLYLSGFGSGTQGTDGFTTYQAVNWEAKLAPSVTAKPYYAKLYYYSNTGSSQSKELGEFFSAGSTNVTGVSKTVEIGVVTMHGTLSVTVNGTAINFSGSNNGELTAYANANYTYSIGYTSSLANGAWTMLIPDTYQNKTVYFAFETQGTHVSCKLGGKTVTTTATPLSGTFTTKTIGGTVKDGKIPIVDAEVILLDGTAATFDALYAKLDGEIAELAYGGTNELGIWTATVLSDVTSAYILVLQFTSSDSADCYITKAKVATTGTAINL